MTCRAEPRIILVVREALQAKLLERALGPGDRAHVVRLVGDDDAATELERRFGEPPSSRAASQIVIVDVDAVGAPATVSVARSLRARQTAGSTYVIAIASSLEAVLVDAIHAGVDEVVIRALVASELHVRTRTARRILELETELTARADALDQALRRLDLAAAQRVLRRSRVPMLRHYLAAPPEPAVPSREALLSSKAWQNAEEIAGEALEAFLQVSLEPSSAFDPIELATEIDLLEPTRCLLVTCGVNAGREAMRDLSRHIMGRADPADGEALALELSNVLMGALRTAFGHGAFEFVGGVPRFAGPPPARSIGTGSARHFGFRTRRGLTLGVWVDTRSITTTTLHTRDLREGMVLGADVHDENGTLVAQRGMRLTCHLCEQLATTAPDVEVVVASATGAAVAA